MEMVKFEEFKYWFDNYSGKDIDVINLETKQADHLEGNISEYSDGHKFKTRPEYALLRDDATYDELLRGAIYARLFSRDKFTVNDELAERIYQRIVKWLKGTDFYTSPASTRYHDAAEGGLVQHTLNVVKHVKSLLTLDEFCHVNPASAILVALVHDWCKINRYESYMRNVKDDNGNWIQKKAYKYREDGPAIPMGHGVASLYIINKFINLSLEEQLAVRWHMGEYNVAQNEMNELHKANETYELVQLLQFADRLSITNYRYDTNVRI